ncbi:acyl transferase [Epilithonimonas pallida]|uniref:Acyl-protein synthetase, LuxE n=1 Tax=Epilithonimonas pallida TaxID=373671 RepID=A0ABY1R3Z8_9FLAO|nr:acyl transferase [Epilithonimonas pallida]SMP92626.1 Acyl-protein synthetase, LuxE [Epilithonimonas pallida]
MKQTIFEIQTEEDFRLACLETFLYQYDNVEVYKKFVDYLNINPLSINQVSDIPFLPIEMFKNHLVLDKNFGAESYFQSSGTTQMNRSKHYIADFSLYEESIYKSFEQFIGKPEDYIFLGLLPNYSENPHSSLIYMVDYLMKKSNQPENGYFLYNHQELFDLLQTLTDKKIILFGVSFALLDFLDYCNSNSKTLQFSNSVTVIETGGMKGRKEEMTKDELLKIFQNGFNTENIYSEYSMTELLSQAYSLGDNIYKSSNWMRILIRNTEDPFSYVDDGKTGAINIIDLANRHSCSFIATQDLGNVKNGTFQVLGRIDHSDIRGCSLLVS